MATEMITLKLESKFLKNIDNIVKKEGYQSRTEFIRSALRQKIDEEKAKSILYELNKLKGSSKKKVSDDDYETVRDRAYEEIGKKFK
jgi:metal-responsive CopG/Arc/MetJ family transcriptional regulator